MSNPAELPLILASASPRRSRLLGEAGQHFEIHPADIVEERAEHEQPRAFAQRLAAEKAGAVAERLGPEPRRLVLGADTIVVVDQDVLGKPKDAHHASELLARILGRAHRVITAVAILDTRSRASFEVQVESEVHMRAASRDEREAYVATGEALDKAGAYAVQGEGRRFIERLVGSETNVIGLPMDETLALLARARASAA